MVKGQVNGILIGAISAICVMGVATTAIAASGAMTITVASINT